MAESGNQIMRVKGRRQELLRRLYQSQDPAEKAEIQKMLGTVNQLGTDLVTERREASSLARYGGNVEARDAARRAEGERITSPDYVESAIRQGREADDQSQARDAERVSSQQAYIAELRRRQQAESMGVDSAGMDELERLKAPVDQPARAKVAQARRDNPAQDLAVQLEASPGMRERYAGESIAQAPIARIREIRDAEAPAPAPQIDPEIMAARERAAQIGERRQAERDRMTGAGVLPESVAAGEQQDAVAARRQRILANSREVDRTVSQERSLEDAMQQAAINALLPAEQQGSGIPAEQYAQNQQVVGDLVAPIRDVITAEVPQNLTNAQVGQLQTTLGAIRARIADPNLSPQQRATFAADALAMLGGTAETVGGSVGQRITEDAVRRASAVPGTMMSGFNYVFGRGNLDANSRRFYSDLQNILRELQQAAGQ